MSDQPPAYPVPGLPGQPPPGAYQRPEKKRPSPLWFAVGGVLLVLGIAIGAAFFVGAVRSVTDQDGVISADGRPATIDAPAGEKRMLFVPQGQLTPDCSLIDGSGRPLPLRAIFGQATLSTGGTRWHAFAQVDSTGDGKVTLTCRPTSSGAGGNVSVRMGAPIDVRTLGTSVVGGLAALFLLGGAGFVILLVTTILWFTRKPRPQL